LHREDRPPGRISTLLGCNRLEAEIVKKHMQATRLYFDDLRVGQRFVTASHELDATQIKAFARQFDPQTFHLDEAAAKESFFGELVASGWHTASLTMKLIVTSGAPLAAGTIGAGAEVTWPRPSKPGDVLHVETEILELIPSKSKADRGIAVMRSHTQNQHHETVQIMTAKLVVPRRPL
jgi:acyl dehydratase